MSALFRPFRALGFISSNVEAALQQRGTENFLTVPLGKSFHIYDCQRLNLVFVSTEPTASKIQAVACVGDVTFTAVGNDILRWRRGKLKKQQFKGHTNTVTHLLPLGTHIVSAAKDGSLIVWDAEAKHNTRLLVIPLNNDDDSNNDSSSSSKKSRVVTSLTHPSTYLNKVLVGYNTGELELINIRTGQKIYTFNGWGAAVNVVRQSPAVDVVAIGLADGTIHIHNLKLDKQVMSFSHDSIPVTSLAFRTDGPAAMTSGSADGTIYVWDLERKRLLASVPDAHGSSRVVSQFFLANEPVLVSTGQDNSISMWIFDSEDGVPRLLRSRRGHSAPPTRIRYYDEGKHILSVGQDRSFRVFSAFQDAQSKEFSQGNVESRAKKVRVSAEALKLPPAIDFAFSSVRERDWANIVTCHEKEWRAFTWSYERGAVGDQILKRPDGRHPATAVGMSACGNVAFVGYADGIIYSFSVQSGRPMKMYGGNAQGHGAAVQSIVTDSVNLVMISASFDGSVKVWNFASAELQHSFDLKFPVAQIVLNRETNLLACALDDFSISLLDIANRRVSRQFSGHSNRITDLCFSQNNRWLLSSSADGTIMVFDVPSARRIGWVSFPTPPTSMTFSPSGDFLATTHAGTVAIYLWSNRMHFSSVLLSKAVEAPSPLLLPTAATKSVGESKTEKEGGEGGEDDADNIEATIDQLDPTLITFSAVPRPRWLALPFLDLIRERNKPLQAPAEPEKAPFFLPTTGGIDPFFAPLDNVPAAEDNSSFFVDPAFREESSFIKLLQERDFAALMTHCLTLPASRLDIELRSLREGGEGEELQLAIEFFIARLKTKQHFELLQSMINLFLKLHTNSLLLMPSLLEQVAELERVQKETWNSLLSSLHENLCVVKFLGNIQA